MISHTKAFTILKKEAQRTFDFAILVAHAVPWLKHSMKSVDPTAKMPFRADYFDSRPIAGEKVLESANVYKDSLSRHVFFSSFSFFEAYFSDVLKEIFDFHNRSHLLSRTDLNNQTRVCEPSVKDVKRKLQEYNLQSNKDRYVSNGRKLKAAGYRFPSTLLSTYGLKQLFNLIDKDNLKAVDIPTFAQEVLHLELDQETEINVFHAYRDIRNRIAHGTASPSDFSISTAVKANDFLRNFALKIDRQVVEYFLVVEIFE